MINQCVTAGQKETIKFCFIGKTHHYPRLFHCRSHAPCLPTLLEECGGHGNLSILAARNNEDRQLRERATGQGWR